MAVSEFELFHGVVLTKLVRSDRPITLRMIETSPADAWSTYIINDQVTLMIKHCAKQRKLKRVPGAVSWTFVFTADQLRQLQPDGSDRQIWAALVGGGREVKLDTMQVCLLDQQQIQQVLDLHSTKPVSLTVRYEPAKQLRVLLGRRPAFNVPQTRLDNWALPGS